MPVLMAMLSCVEVRRRHPVASINKPLAADPYAHQAEGAWKIERLESDRKLLADLLGMTEDEVYEASKKFLGSERRFFEFLFAMRFLYRADRFELTENATVLRICALIFAIEGVTPGKVSHRLSRFLTTYLGHDHKLTLLRSFTFTPQYLLGAGREADRHLMFESASADKGFRDAHGHDQVPQFCGTGKIPNCFCMEWLLEQSEGTLNQFIGKLGERLYQMRCSVVHDGTPVVFGEAQENKPPDVAHWSVSLVDAYALKRGEFVTSESGILVPELSAMVMRALRLCFEDGANF
jgi:hypothetical protein